MMKIVQIGDFDWRAGNYSEKASGGMSKAIMTTIIEE
jgi:hypothetical protein